MKSKTVKYKEGDIVEIIDDKAFDKNEVKVGDIATIYSIQKRDKITFYFLSLNEDVQIAVDEEIRPSAINRIERILNEI